MSSATGPARILVKHIMPNAMGPLIVLVTLDVGHAIIVFAGLAFLGLGVVPPTPGMGRDGVRRTRTGRAVVGGDVSRPRDPHRGDGLQLPWRWHP